jgi:hypothetical protein
MVDPAKRRRRLGAKGEVPARPRTWLIRHACRPPASVTNYASLGGLPARWSALGTLPLPPGVPTANARPALLAPARPAVSRPRPTKNERHAAVAHPFPSSDSRSVRLPAPALAAATPCDTGFRHPPRRDGGPTPTRRRLMSQFVEVRGRMFDLSPTELKPIHERWGRTSGGTGRHQSARGSPSLLVPPPLISGRVSRTRRSFRGARGRSGPPPTAAAIGFAAR